MKNASGQQGVKVSGSEKDKKQTGTQAAKFLVSTYDNFSIKNNV